LKLDPWIKASEIAVATLRGRTSENVKSVIRDFESGENLKCTELLSAVATVELNSGGRKKAKALFKDSLKRPNDNSVAQAEWAAQRLNLVVDPVVLNVPLSFEANSHYAYRSQKINDAINFAEQWRVDEPFATRPVDTLCYLFSLEERYDEARECASLMVSRNKQDIEAALNLLFNRIMTGDLEVALADYEKLGNHSDLKLYTTHYLANGGALAYSLNDHEKGRELYMAAIKSARNKGEANTEALARAYFARMATCSGDPQAKMIVSEAAQLVPRLPSAGAIYVIQRLANQRDKKELNKIADKRVAKPEWHWDALTNTLKQLQ
uniref:tetratricopeptide repeat protein n=1 Tax=Comamonas sp. TaxID=34028 RepID=UPI0025877CFB